MSGRTPVSEDDCVAGWCASEEWCGVTCAMDVLGNKWHPVIVHRLLDHDRLRFSELNDEIHAVTNKVLSESLEDLAEEGIVERNVVNEKPVEVAYELTDYGRTLDPVISALEDWGNEHIQRTDDADACGSGPSSTTQ